MWPFLQFNRFFWIGTNAAALSSPAVGGGGNSGQPMGLLLALTYA